MRLDLQIYLLMNDILSSTSNSSDGFEAALRAKADEYRLVTTSAVTAAADPAFPMATTARMYVVLALAATLQRKDDLRGAAVVVAGDELAVQIEHESDPIQLWTQQIYIDPVGNFDVLTGTNLGRVRHKRLMY